MGSVTMAVKLILVSLVVLSISLAWAQQSEETGGRDRRISLRRFSSRRKAENTRNVGRKKAPAEILEKRKLLFQRNPSRSRNGGNSKKHEMSAADIDRQRNVRVQSKTTTEEYLDVESDPLKALLKTANAPVGAAENTQPADNNDDLPVEITAAIREMKEDNRIEKPKNRIRGNSPRRLSGSSRNNVRVNLRGRNGQRNPTQQVVARKESNPTFGSFPARQGVNTGPAPRQRFQTRPTASPAQIDFVTTEFFKEFDFTPSVNQANQFNLVTEAPRNAFQSEHVIADQEQGLQVQRQQIIINSSPRQPIQQPIQTPQRFQPTGPLQTQPTPQVPQIPILSQPQSVNSPQQVLSQNPFNLLNTNNFHAFDAQFGGSVPTNPGASQLASGIFAQPQTALLQGRDVLVNPQNGFQAPIQSQQVFQPAAQPATLSGHPANDINLQTGAFNLRTG